MKALAVDPIKNRFKFQIPENESVMITYTRKATTLKIHSVSRVCSYRGESHLFSKAVTTSAFIKGL